MAATEPTRIDQQATTAEQDEGNGAAAAAPGPAPIQGRHFPTIAGRKPGSTSALLHRSSDLRAIYLEHRLDPTLREKIMLAVAGANSCRQCSFAHREWALAEGVSEAELAALEGMDAASFDPRTWAAVAWAQAYTRSDLAEVPDAVAANFRAQFSAQEQADIQLVARTMYWMNEISNSVRAGIRRVNGTPVAASTVPRELEALALYAVGAPVVVGFLCVKRRRNPVSMIRDIRPFFREFEHRGPDTISGTGDAFGG
jgi:AhpD family alkylhydroperoxidase